MHLSLFIIRANYNEPASSQKIITIPNFSKNTLCYCCLAIFKKFNDYCRKNFKIHYQIDSKQGHFA